MAAAAQVGRQQVARFEALLDECERAKRGALGFDALAELARLYRVHLGRLARLRSRGLDLAAIAELNALCVRAHTLLYVAAPSPWSLARFATETVPAAFARTWRAQSLAWILLLGGMFVGGVLASRDANAVHALIPGSMCYSPDRLDSLVHSRDARTEFVSGKDTPVTTNFAFGSMLFTHNTRVGLLSFAGGALAGVPTVLLQVYNGILVGTFAGIFFRDPWPIGFLAWILPHGIPELTAITLCAAAGLLLGAGVALPGRRRRSQAFREAVAPAMALVATSVPLFLLAGLTESFVRESALTTLPRLAVAVAYAIALAVGLTWVRRLSQRRATDTGWLADLMPPRAASRDSG